MQLQESAAAQGRRGSLRLGMRLIVACSCAAMIASAGCGEAGGPQGAVHGKVTFEGNPVTSGSVVSFLSETGGGATSSVASDGSYRLNSMEGQGIPVGIYKVLITPGGGATPSVEDAMKASMNAGPQNMPKGPTDDPTVPAKYRSLTETPLSFDVKEGDNEINIELKAD